MTAARVHKPRSGRVGPRTAKRLQSARKTAPQTPVEATPPAIDAGVRGPLSGTPRVLLCFPRRK